MDNAVETIESNPVFQNIVKLNQEALELSHYLAASNPNLLLDLDDLTARSHSQLDVHNFSENMLIRREYMPPPGLEAPQWFPTSTFHDQWKLICQDMNNYQSKQSFHLHQKNMRVQKLSKKPVKPGLIVQHYSTLIETPEEKIPEENTPEENTPEEKTHEGGTPEKKTHEGETHQIEITTESISETSQQKSLHLQPRENKGNKYYEMMGEFYRSNYPLNFLLVFNLKGRNININNVMLTLQLNYFLTNLAEILFKNKMHLIGVPTINSDKPWVRIPVTYLQIPFGSQHFLDIDTIIRSTLKTLLVDHLKSSDRIQMKEMLYILPDQYGSYVTIDPLNVSSTGHRNDMCRPCKDMIVNKHLPLPKKKKEKIVTKSKDELLLNDDEYDDKYQSCVKQASLISIGIDNAQTDIVQSSIYLSSLHELSESDNVQTDMTKTSCLENSKKNTNEHDQLKKMRNIHGIFNKTDKLLDDKPLDVSFNFKMKTEQFSQEPQNNEAIEELKNFLNNFGFELTSIHADKKSKSRRTILTKVEKFQNIQLKSEEIILEFERNFRSFIKKIFHVTDDDSNTSSTKRHRIQLYQIVLKKDGQDIDWLQKPDKSSSQSVYCDQCGRSCTCNVQSKS
jgi:hypothetical protein